MIDFVEEEVVLANDPLLSREALKDYTDKHDRSSHDKHDEEIDEVICCSHTRSS